MLREGGFVYIINLNGSVPSSLPWPLGQVSFTQSFSFLGLFKNIWSTGRGYGDSNKKSHRRVLESEFTIN